MGFVSDTLSGIDGIQLYYIIGLILFIGMFVGVVFYAYKIPRKDLVKYKSSIFENDELKN